MDDREIAYLVLVVTGVAPAPIDASPHDGNEHDENIAFAAALIVAGTGSTVNYFRLGRISTIALGIAGLALGGIITLVAR